MAKALARQVKSWYPAALSAIRLRYPPDIGSVLIYFDPISEQYIFSLVTKFRHYHKLTYESVLACLYEPREIVIDAGIQHLRLPKLASGYDKLDINIVFELICLRPFTHNQIYPLASTDPVQPSSTLYLPQKPNKPEQLSPKAQKSTKILKVSTLSPRYFNISPEQFVRTWINLLF